MKVKAEINETDNWKSIENTNKSKSWFSEKIINNKIYKLLARLTKKKRKDPNS